MQDFKLPTNITATTSLADAIRGDSYAVHAVPVQHSREFLTHVKASAGLRHSLPDLQ